MKNVRLMRLVLLFQLLPFIFPAPITAQGNLLIMPRRVIFEGSKRLEELNLANIGNDTARYVISLVHYRMKDDGNFEEITQPDSGQNFADKWLRFFPHSVILGPNESQVIKIQLTRSNELMAGEYRSHIYFRAIPGTNPLGEKEPAGDSSISVQLIPAFGISIPVIIRVGESTTTVRLSDLSLETAADTSRALIMSLLRTGNRSAYGDLSIDYISQQGKATRVAIAKGIAVYTPNSIRKFRLPLNEIRDIDYHKGKLHVAYTASSEAKPATIAEEELVLH